ncbi:MAG TPA: thermonuclease family protein [bacterium]|nr:thermonuclease family protein [bacterium]
MRNKKKYFFGMLVLVLLLVSRLAFALDFVYLAKLERIIDGDTIVADLYLGLNVILDGQYIRLYGIDAWETRGEEREKGLKAKEYLEGRLSKGQIEIEIRPEWGQNGKGKYGRWLGIVYVNEININTELVEKGHAQEYEE